MIGYLNKIIELLQTLGDWITGASTDSAAVQTVSKKSTSETIFSGTIAPGATEYGTVNITTESEIWVFVEMDQQPWSLKGGYGAASTGQDENVFFPNPNPITITYDQYTPLKVFYLGLIPAGIPKPNNIMEAKAISVYRNNPRIFIKNESANSANAKIIIVRKY